MANNKKVMQARDMQKMSVGQSLSRIFGKTGTYAFLMLMALIVLFPFYWMLLSSVKSYSSYNAEYIPQFFTLSPTLENYVEAFTAVPLVLGTTLWVQ